MEVQHACQGLLGGVRVFEAGELGAGKGEACLV